MMTADEIVDGCGGTSALADALELTPSTVSSWRAANHIPRWWHGLVLKVARKRKFPMVGDDFPLPARKSRSAAATEKAA